MIICKEFIFDSAHKLEKYRGPCASLHGHTYKLQICIQGKVQENGLVRDLREVKDIVVKHVIQVLDHQYLNEIVTNPSVENLSIWIWEHLKDELPLYEIKLWETATSFAI